MAGALPPNISDSLSWFSAIDLNLERSPLLRLVLDVLAAELDLEMDDLGGDSTASFVCCYGLPMSLVLSFLLLDWFLDDDLRLWWD